MISSNGPSRWLTVGILSFVVIVTGAILFLKVRQTSTQLESFQSDLTALRIDIDNLNAVAKSLGIDETGLKQIYDTSGGSGDPPIKVRGGAFTFTANKWNQAGANPNPGQTAYCSALPFYTLALQDFATKDFAAPTQLTTQWRIRIYHYSDKGIDTDDGVDMLPGGLNCTTGNALTIKPFGKGAFYPIPGSGVTETALPSGKFYRRFLDKSCTDEDMCERIGAIDVVTSAKITRYNCMELDCTLLLGLPVTARPAIGKP